MFDDSQQRKIRTKRIRKQNKKGKIIDLNLENKHFESKFAKDKDQKEEFEEEFEENKKKKNSSVPPDLPTLKEEKIKIITKVN